MMTRCLLTCVTAIVTTIIILHISQELEVIFKPFYFWTDAFHTQVNTTNNQPSCLTARHKNLSEFQIAGVFKVKVPKMTSARCVKSGCTFVCLYPAGHVGVQIALQNTTVLSAQIKRQSWSHVLVIRTWSALFWTVSSLLVQFRKSIHRVLTLKKTRDPNYLIIGL